MYNAGSNFYNGVISQSLRVQNSHHLERTPSTGGNQSTWTFSAWIKRSKLGSVQYGLRIGGDGSMSHIWFPGNDKLNIYDSGATRGQVTTTAWTDVVVSYCGQFDLTNSTANDRVKIYVNNVLCKDS